MCDYEGEDPIWGNQEGRNPDDSKTTGKLYTVWRRETYSVPYTVWADSPEEAESLAEDGCWEDFDFDKAEFVDAGPFEVEEDDDEEEEY